MAPGACARATRPRTKTCAWSGPVGRAASGELVGRSGGCRARRAGRRGDLRPRSEVHRAFRPDARAGDSRRRRPRDPAVAHLVRSALPGAGGFRPRQIGPRECAALHREPGADRLHAAQTAVGARPRAGKFRARAQGAAAEGLRALPAHGRVRHRGFRRLRHRAVRRGEPPLVVRDDGCAGARPRDPARMPRIERDVSDDFSRGRRGHWPGRGHARGGRRRRSGGERGGQRHRGTGHRVLHARHFGRGLRAHGKGGLRSRRPRAHVLPRRARQSGT